MNQFIVHRTATSVTATPTAVPKIRHFSTLEAAQTALSAGDIEEGQIISVEEAVNEGETSQYTVPLGATMGYRGTTAPSGYLFCDGSEFDEAKYPLLYTALGSNRTPVSISHGDMTFNTEDITDLINWSSNVTQTKAWRTGNVIEISFSNAVSGTQISAGTIPEELLHSNGKGTIAFTMVDSHSSPWWAYVTAAGNMLFSMSSTGGVGHIMYITDKYDGDARYDIIKAVPAYDGTQDQLDEAVAAALKLRNSWTTDEVWTGGYYLGKKLYRKLVPVTSTITSSANTSYQSIFSEMDVVTSTSFHGVAGNYTNLSQDFIYIDTLYGNIWTSGYSMSSGYIAVEYTRKDEA